MQAAFECLCIGSGRIGLAKPIAGFNGKFGKFNLKTDSYDDIFKTIFMGSAKY